jgi:hypothetical protein
MSSGECVAENVIDADHQVTVLVPCYNEQRAVAKVVANSDTAPPAAIVHVCDNNSTHETAAVATPVERMRALGEERGRS